MCCELLECWMARPKLAAVKMKARLERLAAEREARARTRPITEVYVYLSREELERVEAERKLYAFAPSRSAVLRQLVVEGLMYRRSMRPRTSGGMRGKVPYPIEI
jgi:hypothetical protein